MQKLLALVAIAGCAVSANANLLVNGSFEDGTFVPNSDNTMTLGVGDTTMPGWTVVTNSIAWIADPNDFSDISASDGDKSLDLTGYSSNPYGGVMQTFATTVGVTYTVSFDLGQNGSYGPSDIYAQINNGSLNEFSLADNGGNTWQTETFSFVGFGSSATLTFTGNANSGNTNYIGLDNVIVTGAATPEPSTYAVFGIGALGLVQRRRRR